MPDSLFNVVLVEPEIPQNTGNIGRTCVGLSSHLHLIGPLGFSIDDKERRRAGLDYWQHLQHSYYEGWDEWQKTVSHPQRVFYFSTKAKKTIFEHEFQKGDYLVFGKETKGLPESVVFGNIERAFKIPMLGPIRSLNLATSVAIVLYEAYRQISVHK